MPIPNEVILQPGDRIFHSRYGEGEVVIDQGETVLGRFDTEYKSVARHELTQRARLTDRLAQAQWDMPFEVISRVQAAAIRSLHDEWGVFAASRIELLPHQLWVCRQAIGQWPTRWLVADDVGLGKTIEAGMILSALLARGQVRRLLILCPANLVGQWQQRMLRMFDIRVARYTTELDTPRSEFWRLHDYVVASFHTLRQNHNGRQDRLLEAEPFDLVLVDEAHHLNSDEQAGPTLGYRLLRDLKDKHRIRSMLFFTGTPHRGKDYGFLSLLALLDDEFKPQKPLLSQLHRLPQVMIRNNKANVTNLRGERLFQPHRVFSETYSYSPEEAHFYGLMTRFILDGQMYANSLNRTQGAAVMLALIALQKLASSSVAAIRRALQRRLDRVQAQRAEVQREMRNALESEYAECERSGDLDRIAELDEQVALVGQLMQNEEPALRELLSAAEAVTEETKVVALLNALEERFVGRSVLFFTEYKATQSLLMSALMSRYGESCVTFINGDSLATEVRLPSGEIVSIPEQRENAAARFNGGQVRFLISTEAGGEGIDLQENCHTLIHVDLPWNPMRLHQRVGRLNRYGQRERVDVLMLRNPETVESRIWELLNAKLERITQALGQVMEEPEDMLQLVLGMTSAPVFNNLFGGATQNRERLTEWFNTQTATFGGQDMVEAVRGIVGSSSRFDFQSMSRLIPQVDLPHLRSFFEIALSLGGRRLLTDEESETLSFKTPDEWREGNPAIRAEYEGVHFDRQRDRRDSNGGLMGVGHPLIDMALEKARDQEAVVAALPADILPDPIVIIRVYSRESIEAGGPQPLIAAVVVGVESSATNVITDAALLEKLNGLPYRRPMIRHHLSRPSKRPASAQSAEDVVRRAETALHAGLGTSVLHRFRFPSSEVIAILWPAEPEGAK